MVSKKKTTAFDILQAIIAIALIGGFGFMVGIHLLK
jgi:nitrate reductase NapE component